MVTRSVVLGCGGYLPANLVTNDEMSRRVDTSDEWIMQRTGIRQRYYAAKDETTADLAEQAARSALKDAGVEISEIDLIVVATTTPEKTLPSTAVAVQGRLGMEKGFALDVQAVCSGFLYALTVADNFLRLGQAKTAIVIGAETLSRVLNWEDRTTCVLFGDGAGAVVLRAEEGKGTIEDRGVISTHLHSDGRQYHLLDTDGGPGSTATTGTIRMDGKEVFRYAVHHLAEVVRETLDANQITSEAIDWLVPHQANQRIIDGTAKKLALSPDKVVVTVDRHANTSAASIPLALWTAQSEGKIKKGQLLLLDTMGGGFTWGAALVRW